MTAEFVLPLAEAKLKLCCFAEQLMRYFCSAVWHLAKHCSLIWTLQCNLQGKWLCNSIASTLSVNYIIRYPFITYPLSDLSQISWCLVFSAMKFTVAKVAPSVLIGLQYSVGKFLWRSFKPSWMVSLQQ